MEEGWRLACGPFQKLLSATDKEAWTSSGGRKRIQFRMQLTGHAQVCSITNVGFRNSPEYHVRMGKLNFDIETPWICCAEGVLEVLCV